MQKIFEGFVIIKYFVQSCHLQLSGHLPDAGLFATKQGVYGGYIAVYYQEL